MTLQERINKACPACAAGNPARQRTDTGEWVHDWNKPLSGGSAMTHMLCGANKIRNEQNGQI